MRAPRRVTATLLAVFALGAGATGCGGGDSSGDAEQPATTGTVATTPTTPEIPTTPGATAPPATVEGPAPAGLGEDLLPPVDAVPGVQPATARVIDDATDLVDVLYRAGDPAKPAGIARLEAGGFSGAILRDQLGQDATTGIALLRSYALRMGDDASARAEVEDAVAEVRSTAPTAESLDLSDMPGALGLSVRVDQGDLTGAVVFVTFPAGAYVHGIQGIATTPDGLPSDAIVAAARDLYDAVNSAP